MKPEQQQEQPDIFIDLPAKYLRQFDEICKSCGDKRGVMCDILGEKLTVVKFKIKRYFELVVPSDNPTLCPEFLALKRVFDSEIEQLPVKFALEKYRKEPVQKFLGEVG